MSNPEELNTQVWQHLRRGQVRQAAQVCERLTQEHPEFAGGWYAGSHAVVSAGDSRAFANTLMQQCHAVGGQQELRAENVMTLATQVDLSALVESSWQPIVQRLAMRAS